MHLVCSFEDRAGGFLTKCRQIFAQFSKMTEQKQFFQKIYILFQKFRLNTKNVVKTITMKEIDKRPSEIPSWFKNGAKKLCSNPSYGHLEKSLAAMSKTLYRKAESSRSETVGKIGILSQEILYPSTNCSHKHVECLWKPRRKKNGKRPRKVADGRKLMKIFFLETLFSFLFHWSRRRQVWQLATYFITESWQFFAQSPKKKKKNAQFVEKLLLLKIFSLWTRKRQFFQPRWKVKAERRK